MTELEKKLKYTFKNPELLQNALTHSSFANETHCKFGSNERLEFLGDSVLSIIVAEYLYGNFASLPEGELTKLRASLVCEKSLAAFAREIDLGRFLFLETNILTELQFPQICMHIGIFSVLMKIILSSLMKKIMQP